MYRISFIMNTSHNGILSKLFKSMSSTMSKQLDDLLKTGINIDKDIEYSTASTDDDSAEVSFIIRTGSNTYIKLTVIYNSDDTVNIQFVDDNHKQVTKTHVPQVRFQETVTTVLEDTYHVVFEDAVRASIGDSAMKKHVIKAQFSKIHDDSNEYIVCSRVASNYDAVDTYNDLYSLMDKAETFVDFDVQDEPVSYTITVDDDIEIAPISEEVDSSNTFYNMVGQAYHVLHTLQAIHWNAGGKQFFRLHFNLDELIEHVQNDIDVFAEICVKETGSCLPPVCIDQCITTQDAKKGISGEYGFDVVKMVLTDYMHCMELYYSNYNTGDQSLIDDMLAYYDKQVNYFLRRYFLPEA